MFTVILQEGEGKYILVFKYYLYRHTSFEVNKVQNFVVLFKYTSTVLGLYLLSENPQYNLFKTYIILVQHV